jgi:hypothetical protein
MSSNEKDTMQELLDTRDKHFLDSSKPIFGDIPIEDVSNNLGD